jgi:hypothetical protein
MEDQWFGRSNPCFHLFWEITFLNKNKIQFLYGQSCRKRSQNHVRLVILPYLSPRIIDHRPKRRLCHTSHLRTPSRNGNNSQIIISLLTSPLLGTGLPCGYDRILFLMIHIRRTVHNPPHRPSTDWRVLTTSNTAETIGLCAFQSTKEVGMLKLRSPIWWPAFSRVA